MDYETKIKVSADTSDAQRKLNALGDAKLKPVEVTVAINDADVKARLAKIAAEQKIKVSQAGFSEKDGEKFKIEFLPDDRKVKDALREVTASRHTVIVGMRAKWDVAQGLYAELQKPLPPRPAAAATPTASLSGIEAAVPPPRAPSAPTPSAQSLDAGPRRSAEETRKLVAAMDDAGNAAKKASEKAKSGFEKSTGAINRSYYALRAFSRIAVGMGIAAAVVGIISRITALVESFRRAEKHKRELFDLNDAHAQTRQVESLADAYDALADSVRSAAAEQKHLLDMIDLGVRSRRKNESADFDLAEQQELAALDPASPTYRQDADAVRRRFAQNRAAKSASNDVEDLVLRRQRLNADADLADRSAEAQDAKSAEIKARLAKATRERDAASVKSVEQNEKDKNGYIDAAAKSIKQVFTLQWGGLMSDRTAEGDAIRMDNARKANEKDLEVKRLEAELRKSENDAAELRKNAARIRERSDAMGGLVAAAEKKQDAVSKENASADRYAYAERDAKDRKSRDRLFADLERQSAEGDWNRSFAAAKTPSKQLEMLAASRAAVQQELNAKTGAYERELARPAAERDAAALADLAAEIRRLSATEQTRLSQENNAALGGIRNAESELSAAYSSGQVSTNRLSALGLGSGVSASDGLASDIRRIVDLMREQIRATRENKPQQGGGAATFSE